MRAVIDKAALLLCCIVMLLGVVSENFILPVIAILVTITSTSVNQYFEKTKISYVCEIVYIGLCFVMPEFCFLLPIILYDIISEKRYILCAVAAISILARAADLGFERILVCSLIAVVICIRTMECKKFERELIKTRDDSTELNNLLSQKNKQLIENQDYEIHLATLKERNRIAREIHDNVGHLLSRSILQVGAIQVSNKDESKKESLDGLSETLNNAMTTVRNSVHDLHNDSIDIKHAVNEIVKPLIDNEINVNLDLVVGDTISNPIKFCIIGIIKEGVSNIIKHSTCDSVKIALYENPTFYQIIIEDNGECSGDISPDGMGLQNMRERVDSVGGFIKIDHDKKGFRIFATIKTGNWNFERK